MPKRIHPKAKKVLITTEEILEPGAKTVSKFHHVETVATMEQERLMLALALEQGILAVFSHHYYSFNGEVRFQEEGGPIGLEVSGAVGKVVMLAWCREFHTKLRFQAQVAASDRGETPLYRPRDWIGFFKMNNLDLFISKIGFLEINNLDLFISKIRFIEMNNLDLFI